MKNLADLGGCYPPRPDNTLFDLLNSSYPTQPQSLIANYNRSATEEMNKYLSAVKLNT